jgi:pimeloyl-ACP methyl ester carboxylesterase
MALAAQPGTPVARLVLNDAGPVVARASLERIGSYLGKIPPMASLQDAESYIRSVHAPFGPHSDAQWRHLAETWVRRNDDGTYRAHYDPRIAEAFAATMPEKDLDLWPLYDAIRCPTLVLRGERSDLLSKETVLQMATRGPRANTIEFRGVGHAPTLMQEGQVSVVRDFLLQGETS